jgi:hypothetical protein
MICPPSHSSEREGRAQRAVSTLLSVLNPLRSEGEAFRFMLYVAAVVGTITVVVVVLRAIL